MKYVHYSSRPEPPEVPPRAINQFAGGTGPLGVYAYQEDASSHTFGADRRYVFTLVPTVPVLHTDRYGRADLARDVRTLEQQMDIARPLRMWTKLVARNEARATQFPFTELWYIVTHLTRSTDPEDTPGSHQSGCADPKLTRDLLVDLGYSVIDDRHGILYSGEPEQAVFLTNDSFEVASMATRNGRHEAAEEAIEKYREFHRYDPKKIIVGEGFTIPATMYRAGAAKWVTYQSTKVDPATLRKPSRPVNYIHEHDAGVVTYLARAADAGGAAVDVPQRFRGVPALTRLGYCLGFCFEDADGELRETKGSRPLPDLYTTPDGKCLLVIQSRRTVLAMEWGGGLGVFARGIDG